MKSGMVATGSARVRFDVRFYLNAMFFVVFDLETMFIIAWAIAARQVGWSGYIEVLIFIGVLLAALVYLWKIKALDWRTPRERNPQIREKPLVGSVMIVPNNLEVKEPSPSNIHVDSSLEGHSRPEEGI